MARTCSRRRSDEHNPERAAVSGEVSSGSQGREGEWAGEGRTGWKGRRGRKGRRQRATAKRKRSVWQTWQRRKGGKATTQESLNRPPRRLPVPPLLASPAYPAHPALAPTDLTVRSISASAAGPRSSCAWTDAAGGPAAWRIGSRTSSPARSSVARLAVERDVELVAVGHERLHPHRATTPE